MSAWTMSARQIARLFGVAAVTIGAMLCAPIPSASAAPCPDIEVVFARGTFDAPGVGRDRTVVRRLGALAGGREVGVGVYPVNYPASTDFPTAVEVHQGRGQPHAKPWRPTVHNTKIVLGGFSQGAAVSGIRHLGWRSRMEHPKRTCPTRCRPRWPTMSPQSPSSVNHRPSSPRPAPDRVVGKLYEAKTIDLCVAHNLYGVNGMTAQAATCGESRGADSARVAVELGPVRGVGTSTEQLQRESARQTASGSGRGSVRCWLLALFGPVAVRVKAAAPVVPGFVASVAGGDDAAS